MTTISTYLAASLVAVTFGWVPSERASETQPAEGYDYLVKLSPEDLEALRDGRAVDLVSELPDDIQPIERVRVYVGEGEAPRQLRERDRMSPQRILAQSTARPYKVAKPVTPEWKDTTLPGADQAEQAGEGEESDTAERRTSFQNPNALQQGFAEATRPLNEVGQVIDSQARNLADNTAQLFQQGGDEIRRGAQNLLNGGSKALESIVPNGVAPNNAAAPYAGRPAYDQPATVTPPSNMAPLNETQQAQYYSSPALPQQSNQPGYQQPNYPTNPLTSPPLNNGYSPPGSNTDLVQRYTADNDPNSALSRRAMTPVQSNESAASEFNSTASQPSSRVNPWDPNYNAASAPLSQANNSQGFPRSGPSFADTSSTNNSGFGSNSAGASSDNSWLGNMPSYDPPGGGFAADRTATNPPANNGGALGPADNTGWGGNKLVDSNATSTQGTTTTVIDRSDSSVVIDRLLMLVLGGATCFTWIAYIDVRNKYLSVLRSAPGSGYSNAA